MIYRKQPNQKYCHRHIIRSVYLKAILMMTKHLQFIHEHNIPGLFPKYTVSARGKTLLLHNGCRFVKVGRSTFEESKSRWRCTFAIKNRYVCPAKAWIYKQNDIECVSFDGIHNHFINGKN